MNKVNTIERVIVIVLFLTLSACSSKEASEEESKEENNITTSNVKTLLNFADITLTPKKETQRWYFAEQAERGKTVFAANCAACHGNNAEATPHWKTPNSSGHYPPPPLNGSAHAWHHPLSVLGRTIYNGGAPVGGQMPAFKNRLSETDIIDVIAHFQSYWSDDIYQRWLQIENSSRQQ